jgi:hypothetical protein
MCEENFSGFRIWVLEEPDFLFLDSLSLWGCLVTPN